MFSKQLINAIKDLKSPETSLYIIFEVLFVAVYTWSIIGIKDAGHGVWIIMAAGAVRCISSSIVILLTIRKISDLIDDIFIIKLSLIISGISCAMLAFYGYNQQNTYLLLLLVCIAHSATFSLRIIGSSIIFPKAQSGNGKNAKLALVLILAPIILAGATALSGFLAHIDIRLPLIISAIFYIVILFLPKYRKAIDSLKQTVPLHQLKKPCSSCIALFAFAGISNTLALIIKWIILPLYLWDELGHDPKKLGLALSLITLIGLVAKAIKDEAKEADVPTHKFLVGGYFLNIIAFTIWSITDNLAIVGLMIALKTVGGSIYTYGYLSKLESIAPQSYKTNIRWHNLISHGLTGIILIAAAFWAETIMNNIPYTLLFTAISMLVLLILYQIFCWKFENPFTKVKT